MKNPNRQHLRKVIYHSPSCLLLYVGRVCMDYTGIIAGYTMPLFTQIMPNSPLGRVHTSADFKVSGWTIPVDLPDKRPV
jgi:hypothetical protein